MMAEHAYRTTLRQLLPESGLPADLAELVVGGLQLDSRAIATGDAFIALPGETVDGRQFISSAIERGAVVVLSHSEQSDLRIESCENDTPIVHLPGLSERCSQIAARFYGEPSAEMTVVGITGTNGKTTCSQLLAQLSALLGRSSGVMGTLGFGLAGQPLTETGFTTVDAVATQACLADLQKQGAKLVAMEVSSHSLCQGRVAGVKFDTALYTNLSRDHLDYHGTMDAYAAAKQQLFMMPGLRCAVFNIDDPREAAMSTNLAEQVKVLRYSLSNSRADVYTQNIRYTAQGIEADLFTPWGQGQLRCQLLGTFNLSNLLGAIAVMGAQGALLEQLLPLLPQLQPVTGRMQRILSTGRAANASTDIQVIVDYAHTPDALEKSLAAVRQHCTGRLWCVFGCGGDRDRGKRAEMAAAAEAGADQVVVTSDNPRTESPTQIITDIMQGFSSSAQTTVVEDRADAINRAIEEAAPGDILLIAGKGHEDYQIIGHEKRPFSDIETARCALVSRSEVRS